METRSRQIQVQISTSKTLSLYAIILMIRTSLSNKGQRLNMYQQYPIQISCSSTYAKHQTTRLDSQVLFMAMDLKSWDLRYPYLMNLFLIDTLQERDTPTYHNLQLYCYRLTNYLPAYLMGTELCLSLYPITVRMEVRLFTRITRSIVVRLLNGINPWRYISYLLGYLVVISYRQKHLDKTVIVQMIWTQK